MITLLALAAAAVSQPAPAQAVATVRILRAASASRKDWTSAPAMRRREVRVREKDGRTTLVRLIEYE